MKECSEGGGMLIEGAEERKEMGGVLWEMKGEERFQGNSVIEI